jgi:hypothetical protein
MEFISESAKAGDCEGQTRQLITIPVPLLVFTVKSARFFLQTSKPVLYQAKQKLTEWFHLKSFKSSQ